MTRRTFFSTSAFAAGGVLSGSVLSGCGRTPGMASRYAALTPGRFLGPLAVATRIEAGPAFTEGPAVDVGGAVFFTNIPASQILRWEPGSDAPAVFRDRTGQTNGLRFDRLGRLLACEGEAGRVTRTDMASGEVTVLADAFQGLPLEAPNDLDIDRDGRIYFSSRPTGSVPRKGNVNALYCIDPDGSIHQLLREPDVHMPNGVALAPDDRTLYLVEADSGAGRHRHIKAYDVTPGGRLERPRVVVDFYPGRSGDGLCVDEAGNLYVAAGLHRERGTSETLATRPGIHVFSPNGVLLDFAETPEDTVTNCTFGGSDLRTLYVTAGPLLLHTRTAVPGSASYRAGA